MTIERNSSINDGQPPVRMPAVKSWILAALRPQTLPSVVVFLVTLPLCVGIAIVSGAPLAVGLITGIVGGLVVADLLMGMIVGVVFATAKLLDMFANPDVELEVDHQNNKAVLSLTGAATFARLPILATKLENVPSGSELHVDFQHLDSIDDACLDLLVNWGRQHSSTNGRLVIDWESLHAKFHSDNLAQKDDSMHVLVRRKGEDLHISHDIVLKVTDIRGCRALLEIQAPDHVSIDHHKVATKKRVSGEMPQCP